MNDYLETEWLLDNNLIFEIDTKKIAQQKGIDWQHSIIKPIILEFNEKAKKTLKKQTALPKKKIRKTATDQMIKLQDKELITDSHQFILRLLSVTLNATSNINSVPILGYSDYLQKSPDMQKSSVVEIIINSLPLPNNTTPWEQILDYKNDTDTKNSILSLRRWIGKMASNTQSSAEIEEELEWLISRFQTHMKLHKIKTNTETLLTT